MLRPWAIAYSPPLPPGQFWFAAVEPPVAVFQAWTLDEVLPVLAAVDEATREGGLAFGYVTYEAAPAFDPALAVHPPKPGLPFAWFGLSSELYLPPSLPLPPITPLPHLDWQPSITEAQYRAGVARIKEWLAAGDSYQVNYTWRLRAALDGFDPYDLFRAMVNAQPSTQAMYLAHDQHAFVSASPELFFEGTPEWISSRPMKGTAPRGATPAEDAAIAAALHTSEKARAENLMIVDMIRNDIGRLPGHPVAEVQCPLTIERYPTLFQMTSTVAAMTRAPLVERFRALFPCASVTGAPKVATMRRIKELEPEPRGIYCGAMGMTTIGSHRFNVPIRTVHCDLERGVAEYGTGSGIVWDSEPGEEFRECIQKAAVLTVPSEPYELLETIRWTPARGYALLEEHLRRLGFSALHATDFPVDREAVREALLEFAVPLTSPHRVRLVLYPHGGFALSAEPITLPRPRPVWQVALAEERVAIADPFLRHKTTRRELYDRARRARPDVDDVLLMNEWGEITESTRANLIVLLDGKWVTPNAWSGVLRGTLLNRISGRWRIAQRRILEADLHRTERILLVNSVRGIIEAKLVD